MANTDSAFGFKPVGHFLGLPWNNKGHWYYVPSTDGTAIGMYDAVIGVNTGAETTGKFRNITQATAGSVQIVGVAIAFQTNPPDGNATSLAAPSSDTRLPYRTASTACYVFVIDDPWVIFEAQEDSDTSTLAATEVGTNCDIIVAAANATTGLSGMEIDSNTTTASAANVRLLGLSGTNTDRNNAIGANAKWLVMFNEHAYKGLVGL